MMTNRFSILKGRKIPSLALIILMLLSCIPAPAAAATVEEDWLPPEAIWQEGVTDSGTLRYDGESDGYLWHAWIVDSDGETTWTLPFGVSEVDVLVVAGGGSGSNSGASGQSGGGGSGGVIFGLNYEISSSPIDLTVGSGGNAVSGTGNGITGIDSVWGSLVAKGGGGGGHLAAGGLNGGSAGGGRYASSGGSSLQSTPDGTTSYGTDGGAGGADSGGGGGGAGAKGSAGVTTTGGEGGAGIQIWGQYYSGGGAGAGWQKPQSSGGSNIGGGGASWGSSGVPGAANTGSGGSANNGNSIGTSGEGANGIIIVRYSSLITEDAPPLCAITASPRSGPSPLNVSFTDASTRSPTEWIWYQRQTGSSSWTQFSTAKNPLYQFNDTGFYDIRLTATNAYGTSSRTYSAYIQVAEPANVTAPWQFRYDPMTGIYTRIWFDPSAALPDIDLIWTATLLPIMTLLGSLFFVWIWLLIVAGSWLYTQDTTSAYVIGLISGSAMAGTASLIGADGAVLMVIVIGFAGAGILARVIVGKG